MVKHLLLLSLFLLPVSAQKLSGKMENGTAKTFLITAEILDEGSFQLQRTTSTFTNWVGITNFNAIIGTTLLRDTNSGASRYYRLARFNDPPVITTQPQGTTNYFGNEVRLEAEVTGSWPLRYQWMKDGVPVPGATTNKLTFSGTVAQSGTYNLYASNLWGMQLSSPASVKITNPVALTISGKRIRYVITFAQGDFIGSGNFETVYDPIGFYNTVGSSVFLNDSGYWQYQLGNETTSRILMPGAITYPDGQTILTFQTETNGTYTLTVPNRAGGQAGNFTFVD